MTGPSLADLLDDLDDLHSQVRDFGVEVLDLIENADRYEPTGTGEMEASPRGEWIHRDDLLSEIRSQVGK
jgi:hypothetical protein